MDLCKYKSALGEPGQGIHTSRLFGVAIMDVIMTIIGAYMISYFFKYNFICTLIFLFALGILLHKLFCELETLTQKYQTNVNKFYN